MRRRVCFFLLLVLFVSLLCGSVCAEEVTDVEEELKEGLLAILPDAAKDALPDPSDSEAVTEAVGFRHLFSLFTQAVTDGAEAQGGRLLSLFAITLLFAAVALYGKGNEASLFMQCASSLALYVILVGTVDRVSAFFSDLATFTGGLSSLYVALFAAGGATAGAAAAGGGFASFLAVLDLCATSLLAPLLRLLLALALLSALGTSSGIAEELSKRLSGVFIFLLSTLSMLLLSSLAFESSLAGSTDSVAIRTVKYTLSGAIPVVGGTVSATLGALHTSLSLIKSTLGGAAIVVLLSLLLPLLCELFLLRLALSLCESIASFMGAGALSGVIGRFKRLFDLALAAVAILSVLFLLTVGVFTRLSPFGT